MRSANDDFTASCRIRTSLSTVSTHVLKNDSLRLRIVEWADMTYTEQDLTFTA